MQTPDIHFNVIPNENDTKVAVICLSRPKALNALNKGMTEAISHHLKNWRDDPLIGHVIITGSTPRAFCAGGDVRAIYAHIMDQDQVAVDAFFKAEYTAHLDVAEFPKPVIALGDGLVMGGGAGLAQCCSHFVVSETTRFAMPESAIGLFPDAGASVFYGRCPRPVALFLGMIGQIIGPADCLLLGLAHSMTASQNMAELQDALIACHTDEIEATLRRFAADPGPSLLAEQRPIIDYIFAGDDVSAMAQRAADMVRLRDDALAAEINQAFMTKCPMTMHVFLRLLKIAGAITEMSEILNLDYHLAIKMAKRADFAEGVRAVLIDKSNDAAWQPARLENVTEQMLDDVFNHRGLAPLR